MGYFGSFYRQWMMDKKIYFRIHYRYLKMFPGSRVLSLLSPATEKLVKKGTVIEENVSFPSNLKNLGRYIYIGKNTIISNCESIGSFTSISSGVKIGLMSHPQDYISTSPAFYAKRRGLVSENTFSEDEGKSTQIGNDVLISANAMIKNGVTVGHGAIIGAGAFVDKDVAPYSIVAGAPAKFIRFRFEEALIDRLLRSEWWNLSDEQLRAAGNFNDPVKFLDAIKK